MTEMRFSVLRSSRIELIKCTEEGMVIGAMVEGHSLVGDITGVEGIDMSSYDINAMQLKKKRELDEKYWNNYEWLQSLTEYPLVGNWANARMRTLAYEENKRYWSDYRRNTGVKNSRYPIRSGMYGNFASDLGEGFAVSDAIMSLYRKRW